MMKQFALLICLVVILQGQGYSQKLSQSREKGSDYVGIAGLWTVTPETALHFDDLTLNATIFVRQLVPDQWDLQACFLNSNDFFDYWQVDDFQFIDSTGQVKFKDADGSIFLGTFDKGAQRINGMVYSSKNDTLLLEDKLDFVRNNTVSTGRLYSARTTCNGSIRYSYKIPAKLDELESCSIMKFIDDSIVFKSLMEKIILQEYGRLESFLIIKDDKLLLEEYFYEYDRNQLHNVYSCTKSVVSLLAGIAFSEHGISNMGTGVFEFFPEFEKHKTGDKGEITLKHALTMSSGLKRLEKMEFENVNALTEAILSQEMEALTGLTFKYHWNSPNLLGSIIYSLTGKMVDEYALEKLFKPLGIRNFRWGKEFGVPDCHSNLYLQPCDLVKLGLLVLNQGNWQGKQLVPAKWIKESTTKHIAESEFFNYGYFWWHRSDENKSWWNNTKGLKEHEMICAVGFGGQYIFVIPDLNLVVVTTSSDYNEGNGMAFQKLPMLIEEVIPLFE